LTRILFPFREEVRVGIFPSENFYFLMGLRSSDKIVEGIPLNLIRFRGTLIFQINTRPYLLDPDEGSFKG
jgi:hypothetical protein